jgi:ComF family protein
MNIMEFFKETYEGLIDLFYPPHCLLCNSWDDEWLCKKCIDSINISSLPFCQACKKEFTDIMEICPECGTENFICSVGYYEGNLKEAIHKFKYEKKIILKYKLGELMTEKFLKYFPLNYDIIIPVPLHSNRETIRGFNQSEELCKILSYKTGINYNNLIKRIIDTEQQANIKGEERFNNVRNAFTISENNLIKEKKILLIDDVLTTGSTAGECYRELKHCGSGKIDILVLARSIKK